MVELLLVMALIALAAAVAVANVAALFNGLGEPSPEERLREAVRTARFESASRKVPVTVQFLKETAEYRLAARRGGEIVRLPAGFEPGFSNGVEFRALRPGEYQGPTLYGEPPSDPVERLLFHPDRSSTPFLAVVKADGLTERWRFDPFSEVRLEPAR